jgi:glyoxylase-like metal-dependent hydrolase (beta-lactamase superfamily II)
MNPLSAIMMFVLLLVTGITMLFHIPAFLLGLVVSPIARRTAWFIEFLYPTGIARWGHFLLVNSATKSKGGRQHSRTIEQRFEVCKGRVYIHFIPQLMDNLAYLVVCCPPPNSDCKTMVAFLVDCGDANSCLSQIYEIREVHYPDYPMDVQSVLCTHKHHDHTAGNRGLIKSELVNIRQIVGGAVERVPYCNTPVANGDYITLPAVEGNDMNDYVCVQVIAVPAHTRGSVVYTMRVKDEDNDGAFLFVGDTMFSGGGGVPFESDIETKNDERLFNKTGASHVKPSAGSKAVERCFAEILFRGQGSNMMDAYGNDFGSGILIFPGHEYTSDLISRQFRAGAGDTSNWNRMPPFVFFETASQFYVASHRRALPNNGKILSVPTLVSRELYLNPHFRSLRKRGEHICRAVRLWHRYFCKDKIDDLQHNISMASSASYVPKLNDSNKTPSTDTQWNLTADDVARPIFTTVFSADLEAIINDLGSNKISPQVAAKRLESIKSNLQDEVIHRRPIPGTIPNDKSIYQGILALAILGSGPCAMTLSDSYAMNLPPPMDNKSDRIRISKTRLLSVLNGLGLLTAAHDGIHIVQMIELLWKDASEYGDRFHEKMNLHSAEDAAENGIGQSDMDEIELGVLKWTLYGAEANQPSWFTKFCMPCGSMPVPTRPKHPAQVSDLRRSGGELIRHDAVRCLLCRNAAGCPVVDAVAPSNEGSPVKSVARSSIALTNSIEVELPKNVAREVSLPFDEDESDEERIEMQAVIKPLFTCEAEET